MDEKELSEKFSNIQSPCVELPENRRELRRALIEFRRPRYSSRKIDFVFDVFRRLNWRTATASIIASAIVVSLVISVPMLSGGKTQVLAADIALQDTQVRAALNGATPVKVASTDNFGIPDITRVVMAVPPDHAVIADVNMKTKKVSQVMVQTAENVTVQQLLDIALADARVKSRIDKGYELSIDRIAELYTEMPDLGDWFKDPNRLMTAPELQVGLLGFLTLGNSAESTEYTLVVNISLGIVIIFNNPNATTPTVSPTFIGQDETLTALPPQVFEQPDQGTENNLPISCPILYVEHAAYHLVVADNTGKTWTWDVTDADIQRILEIASADSRVEKVIAEGGRFHSLETMFIFGGHSTHESSVNGLSWGANVNIVSGDLSYSILVDLSAEITRGFLRVWSFIDTDGSSPSHILLP